MCLYSLSSDESKAQSLQEFLLYARNDLRGVARSVLIEKLWPDVKRGSVAKTSYHLVLFSLDHSIGRETLFLCLSKVRVTN